MAKFSLLLYVHNAQKFLPQCLNSLLKQREKDFEVLVFDNASSDGTFPILEMYQKRDKRIKVFNSVEEENASMIKNNLLQKAKGEIVAFLPLAVFKEDFLYYVYRKINASGCDMLVVNDKNSSSPRYLGGIYEGREERKILITHQLAQVENIFYSREFLKKIKAKFCNEEFGSDFAFYIQTIANAEKIGCFNKSLLMTKASFGEFSNRELANYRQFAEVVKIGIKALKKCNLWDDCEIHYIEALYGYLRIIIERLPYPVKNFFEKFIIEIIANQINPTNFDRKSYTQPIVADWFYQLKLRTFPSEKFEKYFYSKQDNIIPIVLAAESDKDATLTDVLLQSIKENANPQKFYDIYILRRGDISEYIAKTIEKESTENVFINFVDVTKFISDNACTCFYKTSSLYFFIPDILSQYNRVTYLKNNVIVLKDIALLNTINIKDALVAGVKDEIDNEYIETELRLISETYINESVLLFNIPLCKKIKLSHKFLYEISAETKIQQAQDILNIICFDKINVIEPEYNCNVNLLCGRRLIKNYPYKIDDVAILNYENNRPSSNYFREFSDIWWKYARKSMFYETLMSVEKRIITDREYMLMKMYIKETFLKIFTFGETSKKHKENITKLQILMAEEQKV